MPPAFEALGIFLKRERAAMAKPVLRKVRIVNPHRSESSSRRSARRQRKNSALGGSELFMLTNPRKKKAKSGKKRNPKLHIAKRAKSSRRGGFHASSFKPRRKSNPGRISGALQKLNITSIAIAGGSALAGSLLTRAIPQQLLKAKNTGLLGYGANLAVAVGGFVGARYFAKSRPEIAYGWLGGGVAALMLRVYTERISQSSVNNLAEMGDVEFSSDGLGALGEYLQRSTPDPDNRGGKFQLPASAVAQIPQASAAGASSVAVTDMASDRFRGRFSAA